MIKILKRTGNFVDFNADKITSAIIKAMKETKDGVDEELARKISSKIENEILSKSFPIPVEMVQDMVENELMDSERKDVAKKYILYRYERDKSRDSRKRKDYKLLSEEFISHYKHVGSPMNQLGNFVYYRTYSRWLPEERRREYWWETVRRAVEYNCSLVPTKKEEAEQLYDNIFNLKQFLSGRTFWVGGTPVSYNYPMANFNCAFEIINDFHAFRDLFYLLMIGSGVGVRILKKDVEELPKIRSNYKIMHEDYSPVEKSKREDNTGVEFTQNNSVKIIVGDSKEGWVQALDHYLSFITSSEYRNISTIIINYNNVRPKGEVLKTFGGTASGHSSMKNMFSKIDSVIKKRGTIEGKERFKLKPIDCLDIANIIGENVVVGGVRRTAEIMLIDYDDTDCIEAKNKLYKQIDGQWIVDKDIIHRSMSNNSIYYRKKPTREQLKWQIEQMRYSGEPGWVNEEAGNKRRSNMNGVNPCGEILLDNKGLCNLTTINVYAFVDENGNLDEKGLLKAQRLSARAAYRMTCVELELSQWDRVQQRDKITGCSLTGWQDMVNAVGLDREQQAALLRKLRDAAKDESERYAGEIGEGAPILVTTIKPEGTLSQLPGVSSGVHYSHSPYFLRRVRINSHDPLVKVCEELGYPIYPEVGQEMKTCTTKVIEFPEKAPVGKTKYDVTAIEQLENYKLFMENYVDHNCSITVHVRDKEWDQVEQWVWDNWDDVVALSFLSLDDSFYQLMPYESITEEEYNNKLKEMKPFIPSLLSTYEVQEEALDVGNEGCDSGICPIR
ncbi:MAG: ribonucleoside-triphosphate reductase, adenosylcobalamin-dependent [Sedimentibacter saalensis]|uniref:ribonucleoside-triphosphate reductase, adenosylcobalamin-dependent n=1 Tax=Sedimentibacter saalensis TaxID=130788 RepID=UPI003158D8BD